MLDEHDAHATFFMLGWVARALSGPRAPDRGARPRAGEPRLRPSARRRPIRAARSSRTTSRAPSACSRTSAASRCRATGRRAFRSASDNLWALECLREAGYRYSSSVYPIQHDHYGMPDAPRFAFYPAGGARAARAAADHGAALQPQPAGGRRRLFPAAALRRVALVPEAREHGRRQAVHLLFSSVGDRSRAAAPARRQPEDAASGTTSISPRWSGRCARCSGISSGTGWTSCSWRATREPARV